jgi:hypothetical protein
VFRDNAKICIPHALAVGIFLIAALAVSPILPASPSLPASPIPTASPSPAASPAIASEEYRTPRAGEKTVIEVFGRKIEIPERDRSRLLAISLGISYFSPKVGDERFYPFGAFYYRNNWVKNRRRLRSVIAGLYNEIEYYEGTWNDSGLEAVAMWENQTLPIPSAEVIEGHRLDDTEIYWGYLRGGIGIGWRRVIPPYHVDNDLRVMVLYEPGYLYFKRADETGPDFVIPPDIFEHRIHIRFRADGMERNLLGLRHAGWAGGVDAVFGRRDRWRDHCYNGQLLRRNTRDYVTLTSYITLALGIPGLSERHRVVLTCHLGWAPDENLDRYSALRLGGGPIGDESEALSRHPIPGATFDEYLADRYAYGTAEYRFEVFPFLFLFLRGTFGYIRRCQIDENKVIRADDDHFAAVDTAVMSGFLWDSVLCVKYAYDWGVVRTERRGGHNVILSWSKSF